MGYRLNIEKVVDGKIKTIYYGTKLYGYTDECQLLSFIYLNSIGKLDEDEYFDYGTNQYIALNQKEFTIFANLYSQDLKKELEKDFNFIEIEEIKKELLNDLCDFEQKNIYLISWV